MCSALNARKYNAANHNTPAAKQRRKIIRGLKKKKSDQQASSEGVSYAMEDFNYFAMNVFLVYIALYTIVYLELISMWGGE